MVIRCPPLLLACAASLAIGGRDAGAYELARDSDGRAQHWKGLTVSFRAPAHPPAGLTRDETVAALERAARSWADAASLDLGIAGVSDGEPGFDPESRDNHSDFFVSEGDWPFHANALAVTIVTLDRRDGSILDADIVFDARHRRFAILPDGHGAGGSFDDLESVVAHELGHALGLAHNPAEPRATMFPGSRRGETHKRRLSPDDADGARAIYGSSAAEPYAGVGCSSAPGTPSIGAIALALVALALGRRRAAAAAAAAALVAMPVARAEETTRGPAVVAAGRGRVVRADSRWTKAGLILVTTLHVRIEACASGACPDEVTVVQLGGRLGLYEQIVAGEPVPAEDQAMHVAIVADGLGSRGVRVEPLAAAEVTNADRGAPRRPPHRPEGRRGGVIPRAPPPASP